MIQIINYFILLELARFILRFILFTIKMINFTLIIINFMNSNLIKTLQLKVAIFY